MSNNLSITITKAGFDAAFNNSNTGLDLEISHIAFGDIGWNPVNNDPATSLKNEVIRVGITSGKKIGNSQIHLSAIVDGDDDFTIREVGFFLKDGTLFGVYSNKDQALAYKMASTDLVLNFDLVLSTINNDNITITNNETNNINPSLSIEFLLITLGNIKIATSQINQFNQNLQKLFNL